jgi:uncharacterized protein
VRIRLIPREERFYADFVALAEQIEAAARLLEQMLATDRPLWDKADEIKEIEHHCDLLAHQLFQRLHRTFVTPIDREDIHALTGALDDIMDTIDECATLFQLYRIETVRPGAHEMSRIILESAVQVRHALEALERRTGVAEHAVEINRLENEADRAHHEAVRQLFDDERDPVAILKWKEVLDALERTTDRCEDVANVLEGVVVKHA